jgi:hypothetical protein
VRSAVNLEEVAEIRDMAKLAKVMEKLEKPGAWMRTVAGHDISDCWVFRTTFDTIERGGGNFSTWTEDVQSCAAERCSGRGRLPELRAFLGQRSKAWRMELPHSRPSRG